MAKYCSECGKKIDDGKKICDKCKNEMRTNPNSSGGYWWILGFFIPVVGLILYLVWKEDRHADAKSIGVGTLVSAIILLFFGLSFLIDTKEKTRGGSEGTNAVQVVDTSKTTKSFNSWYKDTKEDKVVVGVIALTYCGYCKQYKPVIEAIATEEKITLHWFEIDAMSEEDSAALTSAYELEQYSGSSPYTFVTRNGVFLGDVVGAMDETQTLSFLEELGALD